MKYSDCGAETKSYHQSTGDGTTPTHRKNVNKVYIVTSIVLLICASGFIGVTAEQNSIIMDGVKYVFVGEFESYNIVKIHNNGVAEWELFDYTDLTPASVASSRHNRSSARNTVFIWNGDN